MLKSLKKNPGQELRVGLHESEHLGTLLFCITLQNLALTISNDKRDLTHRT